jgi:hypothetical protein
MVKKFLNFFPLILECVYLLVIKMLSLFKSEKDGELN